MQPCTFNSNNSCQELASSRVVIRVTRGAHTFTLAYKYEALCPDRVSVGRQRFVQTCALCVRQTVCLRAYDKPLQTPVSRNYILSAVVPHALKRLDAAIVLRPKNAWLQVLGWVALSLAGVLRHPGVRTPMFVPTNAAEMEFVPAVYQTSTILFPPPH
eukprot:1159765-Pelagomonas_calceolata.AAC.9